MDIGFLDNFLQQTQTDNLKTKDLYPESIYDLNVKVSFGMGSPTHVPWISTLGPGMSTNLVSYCRVMTLPSCPGKISRL
tara:strand:- start:139 stop:375 length:237 start_codon:yes stop_codon:yes gene_type:complete